VLRKLMQRRLPLTQMIEWGVLSQPIAVYLSACIQAQLNMIVCGGTGSGKTTLLQTLLDLIPERERLILIDHGFEVDRRHPNRVRLEGRPPNIEGQGGVSAADLLISALKMRPDRVILSEAHGGEALHMLEAMNTGHDGSMFSMHAASPHDALARLEVMALMGNPAIPLLSIRQKIGSAVQVVVQIQLGYDGQRRVMRVSEVTGLQGGAVGLQDVFEFAQTGFEAGRISGRFAATGVITRYAERFAGMGISLPDDLFAAG
jgi:pilus assembly protein CpaF